MRIEDISPTGNNTTLRQPSSQQSTGGRGLTIAGTPDGRRLYIGNNAGVWRSNDGGKNWKHMERPQPKPGSVAVPGALLAMNVYDLAVAHDPDIVLASTNYDIRTTHQNGIYRSTDGGANWSLVVQGLAEFGQIVAAPENARTLFAACGSALMRSANSGSTWSDLGVPLSGDKVFHVAVAKTASETTRRIYALATKLWFSKNGGATWTVDTTSPLAGSRPHEAPGPSTRLIAIHPSNPSVLYGINPSNPARVHRGDFSGATPTWTVLTALPAPPAATTPSGTEYVVAHVTREGHLYLFAGDRSALYVSNGDAPASWTRLDAVDFAATGAAIGLMHIDPHAVFVSEDFRLASDGGGRGLAAQVNDGGVQLSTDGTKSWIRTNGYTAFSLVNVAVNPSSGKAPAITFGTGDNGAFFSTDGGKNWTTAHYQQGDNDACFSDPRQPSLLFVLAPRGGGGNKLVFYKGTGGAAPNAGHGTTQAQAIPGPPAGPGGALGWNCVSSSTVVGYRPLVLTLPGEAPSPAGDFIAIRIASTGRHLVRSTNVAGVSAATDWDSTATSPGVGVNVFRQGPAFPAGAIQIVQASGGHTKPTFYIGDTIALWKWTSGMSSWQQRVPATGGPSKAVRFHVDPYRPDRVYVIDSTRVWRSVDGGSTWAHDAKLQAALTENGAFPMVTPNPSFDLGRTPFEAQLQDFAFDPNEPKVMFAAGPAGIFMTSDGVNWSLLASAASLNTRFMSLFLDTISDPTMRILYAATPYRGLLKITLNSTGVSALGALGFAVATAMLFRVFRTAPHADPFVTSVDPAHPDVTKPEGKLQKALSDAITAKASEVTHNHILKTRDPAAPDFATIFPIPFTIADVTNPGVRFPVAHYNGDEVDFIASEAKVMVLYAAIELRSMVRRFAQDLSINQASTLLSALDLLASRIQNAVPLIKAGKDVLGRRVPIKDAQRLPDYARIFDFDETGGTLKINFKGAIAAETDASKKAKNYDFGHSLHDMIVNSGNETARNCIDAIGYAFLNGALEAGGFFERPTPADPKTFRGLWVGGNYVFETIRGVMSVNDGPAQFAGTTRQIAKLFALIQAGTFADPGDPNGDLPRFLLGKASSPGAHPPPALQNSAGGAFAYEMNKLGWEQLGRGDPSANWVGSEGAVIQAQKAGSPTRYVVAWQNMELRRKADGKMEVVTQGTRKLYFQKDVVEILSKTITAYQS